MRALSGVDSFYAGCGGSSIAGNSGGSSGGSSGIGSCRGIEGQRRRGQWKCLLSKQLWLRKSLDELEPLDGGRGLLATSQLVQLCS